MVKPFLLTTYGGSCVIPMSKLRDKHQMCRSSEQTSNESSHIRNKEIFEVLFLKDISGERCSKLLSPNV